MSPHHQGLWLGADAPPWWHYARGVYDRSVQAGGRLDLPVVLRAAGAVGRTLHRLHPRGPSARDLAELFGPAPIADLRRVAREVSALRYQNRALVSIVRQRGVDTLASCVDPESLGALTPFHDRPAIFMTWHVGPAFGLAGVFRHLALPVLAVRRSVAYRTTPGLDVAPTEGGTGARAAAFRRALARLGQGGRVVMAVDAHDAVLAAPVACLGRAVSMARGPFALARITGAPLIPVVPRWDQAGRIAVSVGEPLAGEGDGATFEAAQAAAAGRWVEEYLRASPGQIWLWSLRWLLDSPRWSDAALHREAGRAGKDVVVECIARG